VIREKNQLQQDGQPAASRKDAGSRARVRAHLHSPLAGRRGTGQADNVDSILDELEGRPPAAAGAGPAGRGGGPPGRKR
jgi:hypothetical protein